MNSRKPFAVDKGFFNIVEQYYFNKKIWLDAGAGTCGTIREIEKKGHKVFGIELSDVCTTRCNNYARSGQVLSAGLDNIPFPSNSFDLVWSTEVLEHVPTNLINRSVAEIVRVARHDIFVTIAILHFDANGCSATMDMRCVLRLALQLYYYIIYIHTSFQGVL